MATFNVRADLFRACPDQYEAADMQVVVGIANELAAHLADVLRILDAVKLSAGLGKKQIERVERAKAVLAAYSINPEK